VNVRGWLGEAIVVRTFLSAGR